VYSDNDSSRTDALRKKIHDPYWPTAEIYNSGARPYHDVSPYIAFSWPWAKASAGGISILPPMISM
jgi:hypothetical protein